MPPKRQTVSEPASQSTPNKRVTRSSTTGGQQDLHPSPKNNLDVTSASSKTQNRARKRKRTTAKSENLDQEVKSNPDNEVPTSKTATPAQNITTCQINSELVNKPIECHQYTSSSSNKDEASPTLIFTHGAGGTLSAPAVVNFCTGFSASHSILGFQGSMNLKARTKGFHACIEHIVHNLESSKSRSTSTINTLLLGGSSMGARAAVIAAIETIQQQQESSETADEPSARLILISYPLVGAKSDLRDQILLDLPASVNVLFIIGDRDTMCPLDLLNETRGKMKAKSRLMVVRGADHGMHTKPAKRTREVGERTGRMAGEWVSRELEGDGEGEVVYVGGEEDKEG